MLAYHYATALELARAAGQAEEATELEAPALRFLTLAGDRALGLNTAAALENFERAVALTPPGHAERPRALARFAEAALQAGRTVEAAEALEESIASFRERGDLAAAARAMGTLGNAYWDGGDPRWAELAAEASALLEPLPPGPEFVGALTELSRVETLQGRCEAGAGYAERALALAEELSLERPARTLGYRGLARAELGDPGGLEDMREAISLATQAGEGREAALLHNNLGEALWTFQGPEASLEVLRAGIGSSQARGLAEMAFAIAASTIEPLTDRGKLDEALEVAAALADRHEASEVMLWDLTTVRAAQARILALRGQAERVAGSLEWIESTVRGTGDPQLVVRGLGSAAVARAALGHDDAAAALLAEMEATPGAYEIIYYPAFLPRLVRTALGIGDRELAERLVAGLERLSPYAEHSLVAANAALAEGRGDLQAAAVAYAEAADRWERFGVVIEHAFALLGQGRCLVRMARPTEAAPILQHAREMFEGFGATPALAEIDELLAFTS